MERNAQLDNFFELKCKQLLCQLYLRLYKKPGYVSDEVDLMFKNIQIEDRLHNVEEELIKLMTNNSDIFLSSNANKMLQEYGSTYKVSMDRQKELAKDVLGYETTIESLAERL